MNAHKKLLLKKCTDNIFASTIKPGNSSAAILFYSSVRAREGVEVSHRQTLYVTCRWISVLLLFRFNGEPGSVNYSSTVGSSEGIWSDYTKHAQTSAGILWRLRASQECDSVLLRHTKGKYLITVLLLILFRTVCFCKLDWNLSSFSAVWSGTSCEQTNINKLILTWHCSNVTVWKSEWMLLTICGFINNCGSSHLVLMNKKLAFLNYWYCYIIITTCSW